LDSFLIKAYCEEVSTGSFLPEGQRAVKNFRNLSPRLKYIMLKRNGLDSVEKS